MAAKKKDKDVGMKNNPEKFVELNPVIEPTINVKESSVVITFGKFNPPSLLEQDIVSKMKMYAEATNSDFLVFVAKPNMNEDHLDQQQRIQMTQESFGGVVYPLAMNDITEALKVVENYNTITIMCESSDISEVHDIIEDNGLGGNITVVPFGYATTINENAEMLDERIRPLSFAERVKKAQTMKRYARRMEMARERAEKRRATPEKIVERSRKKAIEIIRARILKDKRYANLSIAEKNAIDRRLMNIPASTIARLAKKLVPAVRKAEAERFNAAHKHNTNEAFADFARNVMMESEEANIVGSLFSLIEQTENANLTRVKDAISREKKNDEIKHLKMTIAAKRADLNRKAARKFAELSETPQTVKPIIIDEDERRKLSAALSDFSSIPGVSKLSDDDLDKKAKVLAMKHGLNKYTYQDILNHYFGNSDVSAYEDEHNGVDTVESTDPQESKPEDRFDATDSLVKTYKKSVPGQDVSDD